MNLFNNTEYKNYQTEAKEKGGSSEAYSEYLEKSKAYSEEKHVALADGLDDIIGEFAHCKKSSALPSSNEAQALVKKLQDYITENYYTCTNVILAGLGKMYVADERFKQNIDKHGENTAQFICETIEVYCK